MKSIVADDLEHCYICSMKGRIRKAECTHHIFGGPLRKISERNGFTIPSCNADHNMSNEAVHFNRKLDLKLKSICQQVYEKTHTRQEWMKLVGRNYLD